MNRTLLTLILVLGLSNQLHAAEPPQDGLLLHFDATGLAEGPVKKWEDVSGREHHAITADKAPQRLPGTPALVRFDDTPLSVPMPFAQKRSVTVFVVARRTNEQAGGGQWQRLFGDVTPGVKDDGKNRLRMALPPEKGTPDAFPLAVMTRTFRDVEPGEFFIGGGKESSGLKADVAELLVYDESSDDATNYEQVVNYLCQKWSVSVLPGRDCWERAGGIEEPLKHTSDALPLIDQANEGKWQPLATMSDEFDGVALDAEKWWDHNPNWYGRVPAPYLPENIAFKEDEMLLTLKKDAEVKAFSAYPSQEKPYEGYSAASVTSRSVIGYGCFEIRAKIADFGGTSAWWFVGQSKNAEGEVYKNEIDVFELPPGAAGHETNFGMNLHIFQRGDDKTHYANYGNWKAPFVWSADYHTINLVWSPEWIRYYVDGHLIRSARNIAWHQPLQMIFDMEIMSWLPFPPAEQFPATFRVDYVRAWTRADWPQPTGWTPTTDPTKPTATTKAVRGRFMPESMPQKKSLPKSDAAKTKGKSEGRPNVLVILADDLGYATTGSYGADPKRLATPNIDRLAKGGARFTDAYVTASVCSPSRAGILTGRYQQRFGYYANIDGQKGPGAPASEKMMGRYFKDAGYNTAAIGKWHVGVKLPGQHPLDRGFDKYYGFNSAQTDYFNSPILFDGLTKVKKHDYLTFQFTDETIRFMDGAKDQPFFIYLAYNAVHGPNQAPEDYVARFAHLPEKERMQAAMVAALDDSVGRVLDALKRNGQEDNTLVYFLSDNGGLPNWWKGSNDPWRGFKREQWEGGDHVQFLMRWPGKIPAGQVRSELVSSLDILTTSLAAADIPVPADAHLDGANLLPIFASTEKQVVHPALFWGGSHYDQVVTGREKGGEHDNPPPAWAVRSGPWKLMQIIEKGPPALYNLDSDPAESKDVSAENADVMQRLTAEFREWFKDMATPIAWEQKYFEQLKEVK